MEKSLFEKKQDLTNNSSVLPLITQKNHSEKTTESYKCNDQSLKISTNKPLRFLPINDEKLDKALADTYDNPLVAIKKANSGDENAAIALYSVVSSCFPMDLKITDEERASGLINSKNPSCPTLPLEIVIDRLKILEFAANNGSVAAQIKYAMNAQLFAMFYRNDKSNESVKKTQEVIAKSEAFGVAAASEGIIEAYQFMARSYLIGSFGSRNPLLAYAYSLPIAEFEKSTKIDELLLSMRKNLSSEQILRAEQLAWGCKPTDLTLNPFK
ncbi:MAG: hypothetical protein NVSMB24_40400 [Mucilaginibacter sp.]